MSASTPKLFASRRDASWYTKPGHADRWHVINAKTQQNIEGGCGAWCGAWLICYDRIPAENVSIDERCRRNGCRQRWPKTP